LASASKRGIGETPGTPEVPLLEYRTIDGSGNNLSDPDVNAPGSTFVRLGPARYADGISNLVDGPNPRTISNVVVGEGDAAVANSQGVSGMMYAWGQFIDHDLDLTRSGANRIDILVPAGDPNFPDGSAIAMTRAIVDPATGTDSQNPLTAVNSITGWLDASMIYGSDEATAASLREPDGHMRASDGGNLPIVNGMYAAGDVRAAENPALTALHALFIREHNYQVDRLRSEHPDWSGDQLYQHARAIVAAEIAHITYAEFLPLLIGEDAIDPYGGYDPSVDAGITLEFAGAAFRFGHSIVSGETERIDEEGNVTGPELDLRDTFFMAPADFSADGGADGFLRHLASDASQAMDGRIVEDLRNFLFDPPVAMDLAAINIQRGRDLGLGTLNQTRIALGLAPYTDFAQITSDAATVAALRAAFTSVDDVDLWTGGLSEQSAPGALVGPTFQRIIALQFEALRDGDRFWYENQDFDPATLSEIEHTSLADIIRRNTDTTNIQDDVFVFYSRHSGEAGGVEAEDPDARQLVIGADGFDTLVGGADEDYLFAAQGRQVMTGGAGADRFVFDANVNALITDFTPGEDQLEFTGDISNMRDVQFWSKRGDAVLQVGSVRIELSGVHSWELSAADFRFGD
jgi:peroxidase